MNLCELIANFDDPDGKTCYRRIRPEQVFIIDADGLVDYESGESHPIDLDDLQANDWGSEELQKV